MGEPMTTLTDELAAWLCEDTSRAALSSREAALQTAHLGGSEASRAALVRRLRARGVCDPPDEAAPPEQVDTGYESRDRFTLDHDTRRYVFTFATEAGLREWDAAWREVADWCWWYTRQGHDLTARAVAIRAYEEHGRTISEEWMRRALRLLGVLKASPPFAPHDLMRHTPDQIAQLAYARKQAEAGSALDRDESRRLRAQVRQLERHLADARARAREMGELEAVLADAVRSQRARVSYLCSPAQMDEAGDHMVVVPLYDVHVGKAGVEVEDVELYKGRILARQERLVEDAARMGVPARVVLVYGGDWLHVDGWGATTTRGTPQDVACSPEDMVAHGVDLACAVVERWRRLAHVEVVVLPGNHDRLGCVWLGHTLRARYAGVPGVSVVAGRGPRRYLAHGDVLIGLDHGDGPRHAELPRLLAVEAPELWGASRWRYWVRGDKHHVLEHDLGGVTLQQQPSPAPTDRWHEEQGYVGAQVAQRVLVYKPGRGLWCVWQA